MVGDAIAWRRESVNTRTARASSRLGEDVPRRRGAKGAREPALQQREIVARHHPGGAGLP